MNLIQNTDEWLEARKKMIGASDAPVILRTNKHKSVQKLWREKKDLEPFYENENMREGRRREEIARDYFCNKINVWVEPQTFKHEKIEFMMASLDGIDPYGKIAVEIKCPMTNFSHELALHGEVPAIYYPQLQHQMECANLDSIYYYSFFLIDDTFDELEYTDALIKVDRNDEYIEKMIKEEMRFYDYMKGDEEPPRNSFVGIK